MTWLNANVKDRFKNIFASKTLLVMVNITIAKSALKNMIIHPM
jgi:hypothetical protein